MLKSDLFIYYAGLLTVIFPWFLIRKELKQKAHDDISSIKKNKSKIYLKRRIIQALVLAWVLWIFSIITTLYSLPRVTHQDYEKIEGTIISVVKQGHEDGERDSYYKVVVRKLHTQEEVTISEVVMPELTRGTLVEINRITGILDSPTLVKINGKYYDQYYEKNAESSMSEGKRKILLAFVLIVEIWINVREYIKMKKEKMYKQFQRNYAPMYFFYN